MSQTEFDVMMQGEIDLITKQGAKNGLEHAIKAGIIIIEQEVFEEVNNSRISSGHLPAAISKARVELDRIEARFKAWKELDEGKNNG
jgi:hypothetical protein